MKEIKINVADKVASAVGSPVIVCGNSNYKITFIFDSEWGAYQEKTARFTFKRDGIDKYIDVLFSGTSCTAPILTNIERVSIGVYAGDLRTTTGAEIRCKKSILCRGGLKHEQPPEDVYNQILETVSKKLGSEGGTVTGDYSYNGNTFIHEGNLELVEPKINEVLANEKLVETASGKAITINPANAPIPYLKLSGETTQDGTPTPDAPIEIKSVGDSGSFNVNVCGQILVDFKNHTPTNSPVFSYKGNKIHYENTTGTASAIDTKEITLPVGTYTAYLKNLSGTNEAIIGVNGVYLSVSRQRIVFTLTEPKPIKFMITTNTLKTIGAYDCYCGIVVGDVPIEQCPAIDEDLPETQYLTMPYTLRSLGDIKDEVDFARGVRIPRLIAKVLTGEEGANIVGNSSHRANLFGSPVFADILAPINNDTTVQVISSHFSELKSWNNIASSSDFNSFALHHNGTIGFAYNGTKDEVNAWLKAQYQAGTPVTFICLVKSPQEIPLTETELNAYRQLMTNKGNTTILSEADAEVEYYVNKPNAQAIGNIHSQINKDYLKLQQAITQL